MPVFSTSSFSCFSMASCSSLFIGPSLLRAFAISLYFPAARLTISIFSLKSLRLAWSSLSVFSYLSLSCMRTSWAAAMMSLNFHLSVELVVSVLRVVSFVVEAEAGAALFLAAWIAIPIARRAFLVSSGLKMLDLVISSSRPLCSSGVILEKSTLAPLSSLLILAIVSACTSSRVNLSSVSFREGDALLEGVLLCGLLVLLFGFMFGSSAI